MRVTAIWQPATNASQVAQKKMAKENLGTSDESADALLEVIQPNGSRKAWDRSGREHPIPPTP